jgi:hypothetical protein
MSQKVFWSGIISGLIMAGFLRVVESMTQIKVYTLLLNVDYIPVARAATGIEWLELSMHMVIAVLLSWFIAKLIIPRFPSRERAIAVIVLFTLVIGILLFPSTILSERTPQINDGEAWMWWLSAHLLYGWVLGLVLVKHSES